MPVAKADGEDVIIDQILNSLAAVDPTAAVDMGSWLSSLDAALQGAANFDPRVCPRFRHRLRVVGGFDVHDPATIAADPAADAAAAPSLAQPYETYIYDPSHTWDQDWIAGDTFLGNLTVQWDNALNTFWGDIGGQGMLIGNGVDGTAVDPTGGAGGLWFGDGGAGWNSDVAGDAGGAGGVAFDGNGGAGGDGFEGAWAVRVVTPLWHSRQRR